MIEGMSKITPFLWFDGQAKEAAEFYVSVFKEAKILNVVPAPGGTPNMETGAVLTATFELFGLRFTGLNAGPLYKFNESISFVVDCEDQAEVDYYWERLTADGGEESMCGWLKDKFGLSWQITPRRLMELISDPDPDRSGRAMAAMLEMRKIDIAAIERAADGA
jgi:predicted 3-demethylubiquinone-9 3-methyltransferase (glyoxalase superfamily)